MLNQTQQTPQDIARQRNELQREIVMADSELRKIVAQKTTLESEIRQLKKQQERIDVDIQQKQNDLKKKEFEITQMEAQIAGVHKKINLLKSN